MMKLSMQHKIIITIAGIAVAGSIAYALSRPHSPASQSPAEGKVAVVASFYPLAEFAKNAGGSLVDVATITPAGAEPHDYEPTPQDIASIYKAKLFLYNGNGVDTWAEKIQNDLEHHGVTVINMSEHVDAMGNDPHFWLDPIIAQQEVVAVSGALTKIDPLHPTEYLSNRDAYINKLSLLDYGYRTGLAACQSREIITSHNAFGYLARRYNLTVQYILGLSPDEEPSPKTIADVTTIARQKNIRYIFFETLVSPKIAQTIANEIGAQTLVLNPLEGLTADEIAAGKNYISIMKNNLTNLQMALQCK